MNIFNKDENDAIIKVLCWKNIKFFLVKGFFKKESKNKSNIFLGSISEFEYFEKYGFDNYRLLKKAKMITFFDYSKDIHKNILKDLFHMFQLLEKGSERFFLTYKKYLEEEDFFHKNYLLVFLFNLVLITQGKGLNNNFCSICGTSKRLYCFNLYEGGILCFDHKKENSITELAYLKAFYFLGKSFEEYKLNSNEQINNDLMNMFKNFYLN